MKIRRYLAKNNQEAILKVKMDLGNDALILNTRKVRQKGIFKIFAKPMIEVLAAVDEYSSKKPQEQSKEEERVVPAVKPQPAISNDSINLSRTVKEGKIEQLEDKVNSMEDMLVKISNKLDSREKPVERNLKEEKSAGTNKIAQVFYQNLIRNEVEADIAKKIVENAVSKAVDKSNVSETASMLFNILTGILGKAESIELKKTGEPTVIMFVGPTGVGKTTTLAKIAANYLLNQKRNVGLITADTYRIAAVDQLKTYAEILGIPVSVAYSPIDIRDAVAEHSDKDLILIDTAGRSHTNKTQFEELKAMVNASGADEVYLVMSAATSVRNCKEIIRAYEFINDYKLIFTKIDEAPAQGLILNAKYLTGKRLSYITTGQNVPDDIEVANIEKIAKNLIGSIG